tara:strand:+ start:301 stop:678 length:378 start_codon:yes stop_codon:yes gene_type:complete
MNDIDDLIKQELEKETSEIDDLLAREGGLPDMVAGAFKGSMRRWMWLMSVVTLAFTGLLLWSGYNFYVASAIDDRIFWGVWFIIMLIVQSSLKKWSWMEMNRASTMREIKRLELAIVSLTRQIRH